MSPALAAALVALVAALARPSWRWLWQLAGALLGLQLALHGHGPAGLAVVVALAAAAAIGSRRREASPPPAFSGLVRLAGLLALGSAGGLALAPRVDNLGAGVHGPDVFVLGFVLVVATAVSLAESDRLARSRALQLVLAAAATAWVAAGGGDVPVLAVVPAVPLLAALPLVPPRLARDLAPGPRARRLLAAGALVAYALVLAVAGAGATAGGGGLQLRLSGFALGTLWVGLAGVAALVAAAEAGAGSALLGLGIGTAVALLSESPLPLLAVVLLAGESLPTGGSARGYRFALISGAVVLVAFAALSPAMLPRTAAFGVILGAVILAGALPFGAGALAWIESGHRAMALTTIAVAFAAGMAVVVAQLAAVDRGGEAARAGTLLAVLGGATLLGGACLTAAAPGLRALAARGAVADVGLALVGLATPGGARAAALAIVALGLTRTATGLLDGLAPGSLVRTIAGWLATLGAAGLPPSIGFAARVLVLVGAFRVSAALAVVVLAGIVIQLVGPFRLALARDGFLPRAPSPPGGAEAGRDLAPALAAGALGVLSLAAGLGPMQTARLFGLG